MGTAFTYQGKLDIGTNAAKGTFDLKFTLYDALDYGNVVGTPLTNPAVAISDGLFSVVLDFGSDAFPGAARWLEMGVRSNGSGGAFTQLLPRQELTPTPYAQYAASAGRAVTAATATNTVAGGVINASLAANAVTSDKVTDGSLTAADLNTATFSNTFWKVDGNPGTTAGTHFLGTADNQPLELKVNNQRALRLEPNTNGAPNVIGGSPYNVVDAGVIGTVIAGGGATNLSGGMYPNRVSTSFAVIGGGYRNTIETNAYRGIIGGGSITRFRPTPTPPPLAGVTTTRSIPMITGPPSAGAMRTRLRTMLSLPPSVGA